jgi:hypothetical protein
LDYPGAILVEFGKGAKISTITFSEIVLEFFVESKTD